MGAAAGDYHALDGCSAAGAGPVGALVDLEAFFEAAHIAIGVAEIAESGAAMSDGALENRSDGGAELAGLLVGDMAGWGSGVDAGGEEGFIDVDVAQACDAGLVEQ